MIYKKNLLFLLFAITHLVNPICAADTNNTPVLHKYTSTVCVFLCYAEALYHDASTFEVKTVKERTKFDAACQKEKEYIPINPSPRPSLGTAIEWRLERMRVHPRRPTERSVETFLIPVEMTIHEHSQDALEQLVYKTVVQCEHEKGNDFWMSELDTAYAWISNGDNTRSLRIRAEIAPEIIKSAIAQKTELYQLLVEKLTLNIKKQ